MRKTLSFLVVCFMCIGATDAAVRVRTASSRGAPTTQTRDVTTRANTTTVQQRTTTNSSRATVARTTNTVARTTSPRTTTTTSRTAVDRTGNITNRAAANVTRANAGRSAVKSVNTSRAAINPKTFGVGYNSCRDAYFTCMDQFCATADDSYRRCICSSRLNEIKTKQHALGDASDQIQNFKDLNIGVIPKTAAEVNAMLSASEGEFAASIAKDASDSAQKLAGISAVLAKTKSKSLSTAGTLDIAGDINAIWATTDLASGANIANLTGEPLYKAVNSQCVDLIADSCESKSTLNMVVSAYAMYIENDCTLLANSLNKQKNNTNAAIRETEREMQVARLDNYNAHNSTSINDCIAKVRADITRDTACGSDYVHCLDISGLYLNRITGEPIYSADFYQLETVVSLSGDILTNQTNRLIVTELNRKRIFAEKSLSTCQDLADDVWDEFMRQAITEIYQGQQSRIRQVKDECLDVVNKCYDKQTASLRDFSNTKEQLLLGANLELSEQLCQEKLSACSNLYGGGPDGLARLLDTMYNITSQKIAQNCLATLKEYAADICSVPPSDTLHGYPYACRAYAPGEQKYAKRWECQNQSSNGVLDSILYDGNEGWAWYITSYGDINRTQNAGYFCPVGGSSYRYLECRTGYYLSDCEQDFNSVSIASPTSGNYCKQCSKTMLAFYECPGGIQCPQKKSNDNATETPVSNTCSDYAGSLYQKIVNYALQACVRPSETENTPDEVTIPPSVLQDVNATMDSIKIAMSESLGAECERLGGYWVAIPYNNADEDAISGSNIKYYKRFYEETGANTKWGYCAEKDAANAYYNPTEIPTEDTDTTEDTETTSESENTGS